MLKADHRAAKKLLTSLADSEEGAEREELANELNAALSLHNDCQGSLSSSLRIAGRVIGYTRSHAQQT